MPELKAQISSAVPEAGAELGDFISGEKRLNIM